MWSLGFEYTKKWPEGSICQNEKIMGSKWQEKKIIGPICQNENN